MWNSRVDKSLLLNEIIIPSLRKLYQVDYDNIRFGVSERNVCARLAHHMENIMREYDRVNRFSLFQEYFVDVEYNRMGNGDLKHYEAKDHRPKYLVCDLLIQTRGYSPNLLAVELKKKDNSQNAQEDRERLKSLVSSPTGEMSSRCVHDTLLGAFITYSPDEVILELFENENGKGRKTGEKRLNNELFDE